MSSNKIIGSIVLTVFAFSIYRNFFVNAGEKKNPPDAIVFIAVSEEESKKAIKQINEYRKKNGKPPINYSSKAYNLAMARAKDMNQYNYYDFTNPQTNLCTDKIKEQYGFKPTEYLAESLNKYSAIGVNVRPEAKTLSQVTIEWIDEYIAKRTIDENFLYDKHLAGAVGCDGNKCVFLGLNEEGFGKDCVTNKKS
ncbi:CAP domain-containing protein [Pseudanabaena sp. 'Roaring Creek']|uniref:CAP domain-containing protein n=1 Tax=Pseudanabaena sp. 'Roaring Creek' TaxID=1681830 RepID=UPI0006D85265|nr:CAP domain-containing protein [Pseudanabaena sp. 'Roaring Creek']